MWPCSIGRVFLSWKLTLYGFYSVKIDVVQQQLASKIEVLRNDSAAPLLGRCWDVPRRARWGWFHWLEGQRLRPRWKSGVKQLQMIQNAAARILAKTKRTEHITPILKSLHWLPVSYMIDLKALLLVFKSLTGIGPRYLTYMFQRYVPPRSLRSQQKFILEKPTVSTKHGEAALSYYAAHLWNQLPEGIQNAPTVSCFKSRLKTKLFSDAFC